MAPAIMLLESDLGASTRKEPSGVYAGRKPERTANEGGNRRPHTRHARDLYHKFVSFFRIGYVYDWEEQYKEYEEYWKNYFQVSKLQ